MALASRQHTNYVPFISVSQMKELVSTVGIETFLQDLAGYIEEDYKRWDLFDKTPRVASHSKEGVVELMPISDGELYSFKYVNGHPKNYQNGLQTVTAFGALSDVNSGYPVLLSEMTILTALRTAATSALVGKYVAPQGAKTMAIIGNGAQSEFQALGFKAILGINNIRLFDIDPNATRKCAANLSQWGFNIQCCESAQEAVMGAEIITTVTADKQQATILNDNMVGAGVHINAVGGDCPGKTELHKDILLRSDIYAEYIPQTRIEGEIQQLNKDHPVIELAKVIQGGVSNTLKPQTSQATGKTTVFDSVGFAIEDFSALRYVKSIIEKTDQCQLLDMIADPEDPRDLFGMILPREKLSA